MTNQEDLVVRNQYRESLHSLRLQQSNFSTWLWSGGNSAAVNESLKLNFTLVRLNEPNLQHACSDKDHSPRPTKAGSLLLMLQWASAYPSILLMLPISQI